jgi:hypothetical protein
MSKKKIDNRKLRSFGLIVGTGFGVIAIWPALFRGQNLRSWALTLTFLLWAAALLFPAALRQVHRVWMTIGEALGWVNSRIILTVVYYLLIVPIGAIQRMTGKDSMRRRLEPGIESYKIPRTRRPASHMQHQY